MGKGRGRSGQAVVKVKKCLSLESGMARRLASFAAFHDLDESDVVAEAIQRYMVGFQVYQRAASEAPGDGPAVRLAGSIDQAREVG